jgi:hypothetical protein
MSGQTSVSQPCSVMSGYTPVAMSWSTARSSSTVTPCFIMIAALASTRPWVWLFSGLFFSVQLMNMALRPVKSRSTSSLMRGRSRARGGFDKSARMTEVLRLP